MNKYMYIVDYWLPFPASEYGGLKCIIASSNEECIKIIKKDVSKYEKKYDWKNLIKNSVLKAKVFQLVGEFESGIVEQMIT